MRCRMVQRYNMTEKCNSIGFFVSKFEKAASYRGRKYECLFGNNSCCTMLELGIINSELENEKSGHCYAFVMRIRNRWRNVMVWVIFYVQCSLL